METAPLYFQNTSKCVHVLFLKGEKQKNLPANFQALK